MALLAVRDAAGQLGVTYSTLKRWIHQGSVRTVRTDGGHHRVPTEEVDRLLTARGEPVRRQAKAAAHGVLLALSGRNQLRGIVDEVRTEGLLAQLRLRIGDQTLTAVITRDAMRELKLRRGDDAVAIIKATEVMIGREQPEKPRKAGSKGARGTKRPK
jgi:molybdopterin-binding protein